MTKGFHEMWNVHAGLLFVPVITNHLGIFFPLPQMFFLNSLYGRSTLEGFYSIYFLFSVKTVICVILCPLLCFYSVLSPCLIIICPVSGLPPEPGQCGGVSRVRGQPSRSTTKKEKQEELRSHCCWQILAKTQRKVNIYCWKKSCIQIKEIGL